VRYYIVNLRIAVVSVRAVITDTLEYLIIINDSAHPVISCARASAADLPYSAERNRSFVIKTRYVRLFDRKWLNGFMYHRYVPPLPRRG